MTESRDCIVIGAGPAGLAAAHRLAVRGRPALILEREEAIGGIARTHAFKGYRFDLGGHRFFTRNPEVRALWESIMGEAWLSVRRRSRIFYRSRFFSYPLEIGNVIAGLGFRDSVLIALDYARARLAPIGEVRSVEDWVVNAFGRRLYRTFFKTYTEKVWGVSCGELHAEWAAQRIRGLSCWTAFKHALFGGGGVKTLIGEFRYPPLGPGMMWDRLAGEVNAGGGEVRLDSRVVRLKRDGVRIRSALVSGPGGDREITGEHFISTMPLRELILALDPPPPDEVLEAARRLACRSFLLVGLVLDRAGLFPDQWIYIHSPEVRVGRIQNFGNWSSAMVPDPASTGLGMEYFCAEDDDVWNLSDDVLVDLAARELDKLGLARGATIRDGTVFRQRDAYPIYGLDYRTRLGVIVPFLATLDNLQSVGRNGMHRYNNMDHSMLTGMLAAENVFQPGHDYWQVNEEQSYLEAPEMGE